MLEWSDNMIRTQISFDKALYDRARRAAKRQGVSLAELCRRSVAEAVGRDDAVQPWMKYVGVIEGNPNDSSTVDEVVYGRDAP
jgi:hypothetical protein